MRINLKGLDIAVIAFVDYLQLLANNPSCSKEELAKAVKKEASFSKEEIRVGKNIDYNLEELTRFNNILDYINRTA